MEVTRKRVRANLMTEKTTKCPTCGGAGHIYTLETTISLIDRWLARANRMGRRKRFTLQIATPIVQILTESYGRYFHFLEHKHGVKLDLVEDEAATLNQFSFLDPATGEDITEQYSFN